MFTDIILLIFRHLAIINKKFALFNKKNFFISSESATFALSK